MSDEIVVTVRVEYLREQSLGDEYVFAYHIQIHNKGTKSAQLLSRKWLITDAEGRTIEVQGEGVVGEQPVIQPQEVYSYSSFSVLKTPVGCMQGLYQMKAEDGELFEAIIPVFTLAVKRLLQ